VVVDDDDDDDGDRKSGTTAEKWNSRSLYDYHSDKTHPNAF